MCSQLGPAHLLLLDHPFADHLVHGRFGKGRRDRLAVAIAIPVIGDRGPRGVMEQKMTLSPTTVSGSGLLRRGQPKEISPFRKRDRCTNLLLLKRPRQYVFATHKAAKCRGDVFIAQRIVCARMQRSREGVWSSFEAG